MLLSTEENGQPGRVVLSFGPWCAKSSGLTSFLAESVRVHWRQRQMFWEICFETDTIESE